MNNVNNDAIFAFVLSRKQNNGGFSFAKTAPVTLEDTYYALQTIHEISKEYSDDKTLNYLKSFESKKLTVKDVFFLYHLSKSLKIDLDFLNSLIRGYEFELINEIKSLYFAARLFFLLKQYDDNLFRDVKNRINRSIDNVRIRDDLLSDFSMKTISYYLLDHDFDRGEAVAKIESFQGYDGGFSLRINSSPSYIEETYLAVQALFLLHHKPKDKRACERLILLCEANNGGFGRQIKAIPTLEATYKAIRVLKMLNQLDSY